MNKKILIVTTSFSPENAIGAVRVTKIVKHLVRKGYSITVVSPEVTKSMKIDETLNSDELLLVKRIYVKQSKWFERTFLSRRNKLLKKNSAADLLSRDNKKEVNRRVYTYILNIGHLIYTLIKSADWKYNALKAFYLSAGNQKFDLILSSYPSLGAMWVAKTLRKEGVSPIWVADFRDPINYKNDNKIIYIINSWIQRAVTKECDCITLVSAGIRSKFVGAGRVRVIHNGFDYDDLAQAENNSQLNSCPDSLVISYMGSLQGGKRNIRPFFRAVKKLLSNGVIKKENILIQYAGKDFNIFIEQSDGMLPSDILINHGYIPRNDAIGIQEKSDIILVATWNTESDQGVLTGKLFECFLTRKNIIGFVSGDVANSELKSIVESVGGGYVYEEAAPEAEATERLENFILEAYNEKMQFGSTESHYNRQVEMFSYENIATQFEDLIDYCQSVREKNELR